MDTLIHSKVEAGGLHDDALVLKGVVTASMGTPCGTAVGRGEHYYKFDINREVFHPRLMSLTCNYSAPIASKHNSASLLNIESYVSDSATKELPRTLHYDTRSVAYTVGAMLAAVSYDIGVPSGQCETVFLASCTTIFTKKDFIYSPPDVDGAVTLGVAAWVGYNCGMKRILVTKKAIARCGVPMNRKDKLLGLQHYAAHLLSDARVVGVEGQTIAALARGVSSVLKLNGHTDEGGWMRRAMSEAEYPVSSGFIDCVVTRKEGDLFCKYSPTAQGVISTCAALVLESAALLCDSDLLAAKAGTCLVVEGARSGLPRDISYIGQLLTSFMGECALR